MSSEVRRTVLWLEQNRPAYWHEQIKRRGEQVSMAKAEVFRRKLQKRPDYTPAMSEQVENLRKAEASLQDAEKRLMLVRKWQPRLQHAVLEFHASTQRIKDIAATDVPNAALLLGRIVEAIEAYLLVQPPSGTGLEPGEGGGRASAAMESIATKAIDEDIARIEAVASEEKPQAEEPAAAEESTTAEGPPVDPTEPDPSEPA